MTEPARARPDLAPLDPLREGPETGEPPSGPTAGRRAAGAKGRSRPRVLPADRASEPRRPYHVGVFLGISAGLYAVSLAGVTALQSSSDRALVAAQAPNVASLQAVTAVHDDLERRIAANGAAYETAAGGYQQVSGTLGALEAELSALSASVGKVTGVTSSLPERVALPSLPKVSIAAPAAPAVHATTTASGQPIP